MVLKVDLDIVQINLSVQNIQNEVSSPSISKNNT